jgi:hypothetical protein
VPGAQASQLAAAAALKKPQTHTAQLDEAPSPVLALAVPAAQLTQLVPPPWDWYLPASQLVQRFEVAGEYLPGRQPVQKDAPEDENAPPSQPTHQP